MENEIKRLWLKEARDAKGLTQQQVSDDIDISLQHYYYIEAGGRRPSVEVAKLLATRLDFDWQRFYED